MSALDGLDTGPSELPHGVDICIIGAGIAGVSLAYEVARGGGDVLVIDARGVGAGETARTTAHLASGLDDRFTRLERLHGEGGAMLAAHSHAAAIDWIESVARQEGIECELRRVDGYLVLAEGDRESTLVGELAAAQRAGLSVSKLARCPHPGFAGPALRFADQAQLHPGRYLAGLARAAIAAGARIAGGARAVTVRGGAPVRIGLADGREIECRAAVVATNTPVNERVGLHLKQAAYRSYVVALAIPRGSVEPALWWDTGDPYHYVRVAGDDADPSTELLVVGGEDHKTGQLGDVDPDLRFARLEQWARARFPTAGDVRYRWSGQILEPADSLAFIGADPTGEDNVFVVTGDSGNGMTHGTIAAILLADLLAGRANPWAGVYDPSRRSGAAVIELARENLNTLAQYRDWFTPGRARSIDDVQPGEGRVIRNGVTKLAVYRDDGGELHVRSATCPHMGGVVRWNPGEKTWDCPCHGSRFDVDGRVLNGPATSELACPSTAVESRAAAGRRR